MDYVKTRELQGDIISKLIIILVFTLNTALAQSCTIQTGSHCTAWGTEYYNCRNENYACLAPEYYSCNCRNGACLKSHPETLCTGTCKPCTGTTMQCTMVCDSYFLWMCTKSHQVCNPVCNQWGPEYCCMSKQVTICDEYQQVCDTCSRTVTSTCSRQVCDSRSVCTTTAPDYGMQTCNNDGTYCNGNSVENRDYACDASCSYRIINGYSCLCGCGAGFAGAACNKCYPVTITNKYSFLAYDASQESLLNDFLGVGSPNNIDTYLASKTNTEVINWGNYWMPKWNPYTNKNELVTFTNNKVNEYVESCGDGICNYGDKCSNCITDCGKCYPVPVSRVYTLLAYNSAEENDLINFLGVNCAPTCKDIDTYISGLTNTELINWGNYWKARWNAYYNSNELITFTNDKVRQYTDYCGDKSCNNGESCNSCSTDCGICCTNHSITNCSEGNIYWFDSCNNRQELITNCSINLRTCELPTCSDSICSKTIKPNCCGNNNCESGESCATCLDCKCNLGIDAYSITCKVGSNSCALVPIYASDLITALFNLINATHPSGINVRTEFKTSNSILGSITSTSNNIQYSFHLPDGRQTIIITATDLIDNEAITKTLFSLEIGTGTNNYTVIYPFNPTSGEYTNTIRSNNPLGLTPWNESLGEGLTIAIIAGIGAIVLIKGRLYFKKDENAGAIEFNFYNSGTYIPSNPMQFIEDYNKSMNERNELWDSLFSAYCASADFVKGFIFGSRENSNASEIAGDFVSGMLIYGDVRDFVLYSLSKLGFVEEEYDEIFLSFAIFGLITELFDVGDAFVTTFKQVWKKIPKPVKEAWTLFFKNASKNMDEFIQLFSKVMKNIPLEKIQPFLEGTSHLINKIPFNKLDELAEIFNKVAKHFDDPGKIFRKLLGMDEAIKLSKYIDDAGEEAFSKIARILNPDEIVDLTINRKTTAIIDETVSVRNGYSWITNYGDDLDDGFSAVSKKFQSLDNRYVLESSPDGYYYGYFSTTDQTVHFNKEVLDEGSTYLTSLHEFTHRAADSGVIVKGFDNPTQAYNVIFEDKLGTINHYYSQKYGDGINMLENQFHDTVVNKLMLTNENADFSKWYAQWLDGYQDNIDLLRSDSNAIEFIKNKKELVLPELAEMKVLFEQVDIEKAVKIDELIDSLRKTDTATATDFDMIYDAYKGIFDKVKWK